MMLRLPTLTATLSCTLAVLLLSACAVPPDQPATMASSQAPAQADDGIETMTGSRLKRKSTDRMLKGVDNATFRRDNTIHSIGNEVGSRGN